MSKKCVIFTGEELKDMLDGKVISLEENDGSLVLFMTEETFEKCEFE